MNAPGAHRRSYAAWRLLLLCCLAAVICHAAHADSAGDKKRAQLATVRRIVVVPPFFGTPRPAKAPPPPAAAGGETPPMDLRLKSYVEQLRKLEAHAREAMPKRVVVRTPFQVVPADEMADALKTLNLTPERLFQNDGQMRGSRFAQPDPEAVRKLAARCHADAVLLGTMDEPRKTNGHYYYDPLYGLDYVSGHVRSKAGFFVLLANGTEVLHDYVEVLHPLSRIGHHEYVLADWMEAEDEAIEDLLDELTRYTPPKPF